MCNSVCVRRSVFVFLMWLGVMSVMWYILIYIYIVCRDWSPVSVNMQKQLSSLCGCVCAQRDFKVKLQSQAFML